MQIAVTGSGYLATVISACLADLGNPVTCCDGDGERILELAQGSLPFYEKNLDEIVRRNARAGRLHYSTESDLHAIHAQVFFFANDTNTYLVEFALRVAASAAPDAVFVICTPVPVGTASRLEQRLHESGFRQSVVSHPLSLTDGCAVEDFNWPDRILLGTHSPEAVAALKQIYRPLVMRGIPVIVTNFETAELVREAATAFVATKISFINELASLCEHVNADAVDLALALGLDKRIAPRCLQPGVGLGGTFVEADMDSLASLASGKGVGLKILSAAREVHRLQTNRLVQKITSVLDSLRDKRLGFLGLAFKPHTSSVAGSSSVALARELAARGASVNAYDPIAMQAAERELNDHVRFCESAYAAAEDSDALVVGTGWPEFRALDFTRLKRVVRRPLVIDTKNLLDAERMRGMGFQYLGVGRS